MGNLDQRRGGKYPRGKPQEFRFWVRTTRDEAAGCLLWTGERWGRKGVYGRAVKDGRRMVAHRAAWEYHTKQVAPRELMVCHHCDTPLCVEPTHLFLGTNSDNMRDSGSKGRHWTQKYPELIQGENSTSAKLTSVDVEQILKLRATGLLQRQVAVRFGVSRTAVYRIEKGLSYKNRK